MSKEAKDKAEELIEFYYYLLPMLNSYKEAILISKKCALKAVDEIIKVSPIDKYENLQSELTPKELGLYLFEEYWQQVKQEILNRQ